MGKIPDLTRIDAGERETELARTAPMTSSPVVARAHGQSRGQLA
jgi:hypothetical protein